MSSNSEGPYKVDYVSGKYVIKAPDGHTFDCKYSLSAANEQAFRLNRAHSLAIAEERRRILDRCERHGYYYWIHQNDFQLIESGMKESL